MAVGVNPPLRILSFGWKNDFGIWFLFFFGCFLDRAVIEGRGRPRKNRGRRSRKTFCSHEKLRARKNAEEPRKSFAEEFCGH